VLLKAAVQEAISPLENDPKQVIEHYMNDWPHSLPHDLAKALAELDCRRCLPSDADRWGVIRDWLVKHSVQAPDNALPTSQEIKQQG
jgi:hypothetical protein